VLRIAVVAALLSGGCVIPFAIPPTRMEGGVSTLAGGTDGSNRAYHVGGGMHLASGNQRKDLPLDLGLGGFWDFLDHGPNAGGGYVDAALFTDKNKTSSTRTALGMRGELRYQAGQYGAGAKLRVDHELFAAVDDSFSEDDRCGVAVGSHHGNAGVGVYVEAGRVWQADGTAWLATAGVTLRMPGIMGVWIGIPGC